MGEGSGRCEKRAGVHPVRIHEIKTGKKRGSVNTLKRLAQALG